ncbi:hypothetical protein TWF281_008643 [Arthrobotrys megalospora]
MDQTAMSTVSEPNIGAAADSRNVRCGANLMDVPPEILWDITSHIEARDLVRLVQVSRKAYEICIPRLYQKIRIRLADLRNPSTLLKDGSVNLRHVRSIQVIGTLEDAGYWRVDLPDDAIEWICRELGEPLDKFLSYLENGSLQEFVWQTDMYLGRKTAEYLLQSQPNIQSLSLCRLILSTGHTDPSHNISEDDLTSPECLDFCFRLLNQQQLLRLDIPDVNGLDELRYLMEVVIKHQRTLKHVRFGFPKYTAHKLAHSSAGILSWDKNYIRDAIAACGVHLGSTSQIVLPALKSLEISDFELSADEVREAANLLGEIIQFRRLQSLKLRNCGYLDSIIWPSLTAPFRISVLHLTVHIDHEAVYNFLEKQDLCTTLTELRLVIRVQQETRFPDVRRHAKSLRVLYLAMIQTYNHLPGTTAAGMAYMYPTPMGTIYQLLSLPRLEELAITFQNPKISPIKLDRNSFPSLRVLWILAASGLIEPQQLRGGFFNIISMRNAPSLIDQTRTQKSHLDKIFGNPEAYPNKLEIIGMGLKENREHPTNIVQIPKLPDPNIMVIPGTEIQDFDRVQKAITVLGPWTLREFEVKYSWIKVFDMGKGIWGARS